MDELRNDDRVAIDLWAAIHEGDLDRLARLLADHPGLAGMLIVGPNGSTRSPLHHATDWPGYFPNGPAIVRMLLEAGADPDVPTTGPKDGFRETPLHWAASNDDAEVAAALIDGGADLELDGGSIAGGTPLVNAVGYGCWHVARLLVASGARIDDLWVAAAVGAQARVEELLAADPSPSAEDVNEAFWQACHGRQRRVAELLLDRGADIDFVPDYNDNTAIGIVEGIDTRQDTMINWLRERGATSPDG